MLKLLLLCLVLLLFEEAHASGEGSIAAFASSVAVMVLLDALEALVRRRLIGFLIRRRVVLVSRGLVF